MIKKIIVARIFEYHRSLSTSCKKRFLSKKINDSWAPKTKIMEIMIAIENKEVNSTRRELGITEKIYRVVKALKSTDIKRIRPT